MKIGILSDSHGDRRLLARVAAGLVGRGAEALVHCGDIGSSDCLRELGRAGVSAYAVAGNMDRKTANLAAVAAGKGVCFGCRTIEVPLGDGRHLVATHGDNEVVMAEVLAGKQFAYVCHGHTHRQRDQRIGGIRIINPGAIRNGRPDESVALLDTETDGLMFIGVGAC